jgi:hypothetical protein
MLYRILADGVLIIHFAFVLFVAAGGIMVYYRLKLAWAHLPCAAWGVLIEFYGWTCPLTPLENYLRCQGAAGGYDGSFLAHHLISILYPQMLTRQIQTALGGIALGINALIYGWIWYRFKK